MKELKELRLALLNAVGLRLAQFGFRPKPVGQSFLRPLPGGRSAFHISFINHPDDFDVTGSVAIRFDALEDLLNHDSKFLSKKERTQTYSLGAELGNIAGTGQRRWTVTRDSNVDDIAAKIIVDFQEIGIPYLEKASTMESALDLFRQPGRAAWLHCPFHHVRAKSVVGLAYLLGRKNDLPSLIQEQTLVVKSLYEPGLEEFQQFVESLANKET